MRADHLQPFFGKMSDRLPTVALIQRAEQGRPTCGIPGVGLKIIRGHSCHIFLRHILHAQPYAVHPQHPRFGQRHIVDVGCTQRLPKAPAARADCGRQRADHGRQRADRAVQPLQHPLFDACTILLAAHDDAGSHAHRLVARPGDHTRGSQRPAAVQIAFDLCAHLFRLLRQQRSRGHLAGHALRFRQEGHQEHFHRARPGMLPQVGARHGPRPRHGP